jgi:Cdc6-like AAA superfamily ATPase
LSAIPTSSKPLVSPSDHTKSVKLAQDGLAERVRDLPLFGKIVLCVLVTLAQKEVQCALIKDLKECVTACLTDFPDELQVLTTENFKDLLDMLVDNGLLKMDHIHQASRNRLSIAQYQLSTVRLGTQLEDVTDAVQKDLVDQQAFWATIQHEALEHWRLVSE